ncbi:MAG: hypothetical protein ABSF09_07010 [Candidatus Bathyarchaeia archaeon]|jgi:N-acyl-D-aspartate/D-glutamate deacylase
MNYLSLEGGTIIDGTGKSPMDGYNLVIKEGRIEKLAKGQTSLPSGANRMDISGMALNSNSLWFDLWRARGLLTTVPC